MSFSEAQLANLKKIFTLIDTDKSGSVDRAEFFKYLKKCQNDTTKEDADEAFEASAADKTSLSFDVFSFPFLFNLSRMNFNPNFRNSLNKGLRQGVL